MSEPTPRTSGTTVDPQAIVDGRVPDIRCEEFSLFGSDLLVRTWHGVDVDLSIHRYVTNRKERHEANLSLASHLPIPEALEVFLETHESLIYVGLAKAHVTGGEVSLYTIHDPSESLDHVLLPPSGWDAARLVEAIGTHDSETLVREFVASWLTNLQPGDDEVTGAPEPVARWQSLHAQLVLDNDHPFQCYPPTWHGEDPSTMFFMDREQTGGAFFIRHGAVWHSDWLDRGREVPLVNDIWQFALQFVIFGLGRSHVGYCGRFDSQHADQHALPIAPWPEFLEPNPVVFVGGPGWIGTTQDGWVNVRATSLEVLRALGRVLSEP